MRLRKRILGLLRDESGTATIESVLWLPVFIAFFCMIADASFIFFGQNRAYRIVQDANRNLSVGRLVDSGEVEAFVTASLADFAPNSVVQSNINSTSGIVTTVVSLQASDLVATGLITAFLESTITVGSSHFVEY